MNKIHIVNLLVTRKCNLRCSYCGIVRNMKTLPKTYPKMKHYYDNEMSTKLILNFLEKLKNHNPDAFVIIYGGEPILRSDLFEIVQYCNDLKLGYTIISNNTIELQDKLDDLLNTVHVAGYTASIDPLIISDSTDVDRRVKSEQGLERLLQYKYIIKDLVAEITVDKNNVPYLYDLVKKLSDLGINSDITFIDTAKSPYYDFSNINDPNLLIKDTIEVKKIFDRIIKDNLDVHMAKSLLPKIVEALPSKLDCKMEKDINTICVDADGTMRLCLRIKGTSTPRVEIDKLFAQNGKLDPFFIDSIKTDKQNYCRLCNHTCYIMGDLISKGVSSSELVHEDKRGD